MALTASLTINSVQTPFLQAWQANHAYTSFLDGSYTQQYTDIIVDSNGNYQVCAQSGTSGGSMPNFAATVPGDVTNDGPDVEWVCNALYDGTWQQITYPGIVTLGSSVNLTWTSTDAVSATLNGTPVSLNGSGDFTPGLNQYDDTFQNLYFASALFSPFFTLTGAAKYVFVATDSMSNTAAGTQYFALAGPTNVTQTDSPVAVDILFTGPEGDSGSTGPNSGFCVQRGFGPLWNNPSSKVGCSFASVVIPPAITAAIPYAANTAYAVGDVRSVPWDTLAPGIPLIQCVQAGTSGPNSASRTPCAMIGLIFSDDNLNYPNTGSTAVWQALGSIFITLAWTGSEVPAPDSYPCDPNPIGPLGDPTATVPVMLTKYGDANNFIVDPTEAATYCEPFNTATIPGGANWIVTALGTGFINSMLSNGVRINIASSLSSFFIPESEVTPPPANTGNIMVQKVVEPNTNTQGFDFNASWGGPTFTLHNGDSQDSGPLTPGNYSIIETALPNWLTTTDIDPLNIPVVANQTTTITFTNRKQSGYLLARDLNTWGDRGTQGDPAANDADLYTQCFVTVGSIQLSTPGSQLMEVRHIVGYFDAVGTLGQGGAPSQPFVSVLPNEIAATNGAQFINLPEVIQEPPYGATASRSLQQLRWPLNAWSNDSTSLLMHHLQVKMLFAPENAPNTIKMLVVKSDQE